MHFYLLTVESLSQSDTHLQVLPRVGLTDFLGGCKLKSRHPTGGHQDIRTAHDNARNSNWKPCIWPKLQENPSRKSRVTWALPIAHSITGARNKAALAKRRL